MLKSVVGKLRQRQHHSFREASLLSRMAVTQQIRVSGFSEPWGQRGLSLYTIYSRLQKWGVQGYSLFHTWSHSISLAILTSGARWPFSYVTPGVIWLSSNSFCFFSLLHSLSRITSLPPPCLPATRGQWGITTGLISIVLCLRVTGWRGCWSSQNTHNIKFTVLYGCSL
jgi:hypothetical protein